MKTVFYKGEMTDACGKTLFSARRQNSQWEGPPSYEIVASEGVVSELCVQSGPFEIKYTGYHIADFVTEMRDMVEEFEALAFKRDLAEGNHA